MRRRTAAVLVFAAWTALAIFFATGTSLTYISQGRPGLWPKTLATELAQWWIWAALTPVIAGVTRRFPIERRALGRAIAVHLPLAAGVALATVLAENRVRVWLFHVRPYLLISNLALKFVIYWSLVAVAQVLDRYGRSRARAAEAETRLSQAQVQILRAQLQPHFLFNALNTISELIHEDPDRADQMVDRLSALLRASLDASGRPFVTLAEEIAVVRHYLAIQEARFGDRIDTRIEIAAPCETALVPHLSLQPLVENAIRHGLAPRAGGGRLTIAATRVRHDLVLTVEDDGVGLPPEGASPGVGHANTRARLGALYGGRASFTLAGRPGGGAAARITLPWTDAPGRRP